MASKILTFGTVTKKQNDPFNWSGAVGKKEGSPAAVAEVAAAEAPKAQVQLNDPTSTVTADNASTVLQGGNSVSESLRKKRASALSTQLGINT